LQALPQRRRLARRVGAQRLGLGHEVFEVWDQVLLLVAPEEVEDDGDVELLRAFVVEAHERPQVSRRQLPPLEQHRPHLHPVKPSVEARPLFEVRGGHEHHHARHAGSVSSPSGRRQHRVTDRKPAELARFTHAAAEVHRQRRHGFPDLHHWALFWERHLQQA
jgi:hypothetical protein